MSDSLIKVPFHGDTIEAVAKDGSWMASLRRMCENLDVDYWTQLRKLKEKPWATVVIMPMVGADGKNREMAMIDRRTMTMWLANINPGKVKPELRSKIEAYQCEAADALDKYFNEGAAIRFKTNSMDEESLILAKANQIQSRLLGEARRENLELRASNEKMRPLALLGEAFVSADGTMSVRQAARHFQAIDKRMNCDTVYGILRGAGYIELRSKAPTVKAVKPGYLKPVMSRKANGKLDRQCARFTAKGVNWFIDRFIYGRSQGRLPGGGVMSVATKPKTQRRTMPDAMEVELFKDLRRALPKARHYDRNGNLLWRYVRIPEMLIYGGAPTLCGCWLKDDPKHTVYRSSRNEGTPKLLCPRCQVMHRYLFEAGA